MFPQLMDGLKSSHASQTVQSNQSKVSSTIVRLGPGTGTTCAVTRRHRSRSQERGDLVELCTQEGHRATCRDRLSAILPGYRHRCDQRQQQCTENAPRH